MTAWHPFRPPYGNIRSLARQIAILEASLDAHPDDPDLHHNLAIWLFGSVDYSWADKNLRFALALDPNHIKSNLALGTMRAVCPDPTYRNGKEAVLLAEKALRLASENDLTATEWVLRRHLQALAAAHAENGDWSRAVSKQNEAIACTSTRSHVPKLTKQLLAYMQHHPLRTIHLLL